MSTHTTVVPPVDENDEAGAPYAESIVIDEGGIDLKIDGHTIIGASFEGLDSYQLAYELLPETFILPPDVSTELFELGIEAFAEGDCTDVDLEGQVRLYLSALARRRGYEKK